ncbi:MAG: hypothetical protein WDZ44_02115, partial [Candidatus Spechtbacterales bacterium]
MKTLSPLGNKKIAWGVFVGVLFFGGLGVARIFPLEETRVSLRPITVQNGLVAKEGAFLTGTFSNPSHLGEKPVRVGITSHHLPTASGFIHDFYGRLHELDPDREVFFIVGPDHFERCVARVTVGGTPYATSSGTVG